jgi:hypothetical protein
MGAQNPRKQTASNRELIELGKDCKMAAQELYNQLERARAEGGHRKWQNMDQAIESVYGGKSKSQPFSRAWILFVNNLLSSWLPSGRSSPLLLS